MSCTAFLAIRLEWQVSDDDLRDVYTPAKALVHQAPVGVQGAETGRGGEAFAAIVFHRKARGGVTQLANVRRQGECFEQAFQERSLAADTVRRTRVIVGLEH